MGHTFAQQKVGTEDNANLVLGKDGTTLNDECYNCCKLGHLAHNFPGAGHTGTCSLQVVHNFTQKQIHKNEPINDNYVLLVGGPYQPKLDFG